MEELKLDLAPHQARRLARGHVVQLKHHQLHSGHHKVVLSRHKAHKIHHAHRHHKGVRLHLDEHEIEASGFKDFARKVGRLYKEHVRPIIGPRIRKTLTSNLERLGAIGGPLGYEVAKHVAPKLVNWVGDKTGAFGLKKHHPARHRKTHAHLPLHHTKGHREGTYSGFIAGESPAMNPAVSIDYIDRPSEYWRGMGLCHSCSTHMAHHGHTHHRRRHTKKTISL